MKGLTYKVWPLIVCDVNILVILACVCMCAGVLEEAKFFGIFKALEPLESLVRVSMNDCTHIMYLCSCVCSRMRSCLLVAIFHGKSFFIF